VVYSAVWGCGGFLSPGNKALFDQWWRQAFNKTSPLYPGNGLIWHYDLAPDWSQFTPYPVSTTVINTHKHSPFVSTAVSQSYQRIIGALLKQGTPVFLNGDNGSGKTALVTHHLRESSPPDSTVLHLYVNQLTSAQSVWSQVRDCLEWRWGMKYTPKASKKLLCFIDDIHVSKVSLPIKFNSICFNTFLQFKSASEFIREHISSGGYNNPESGKAHSISDLNYLVTGNSGSRYRQLVDSRLLKHFIVLHWDGYKYVTYFQDTCMNVCFFSSEQMCGIFSKILVSCVSCDVGLVDSIARSAVQVHNRVSTMFLASPERLHYIFSLENISAIFRFINL